MCQKFFKFNKKKFILCNLTIFVIILAAVTLGILCSPKGEKSQFLPRTCYYLYAEADGTERFLQQEAERLRLGGGAGEIMEYLGKKYLLIAAFLERAEAQSALALARQTYASAGILEITDYNFSRAQQAKLSANYAGRLFLSRTIELVGQVVELSKELIGGQVTAPKFFAELEQSRMVLEGIDCEDSGEIGKIVQNYRQKMTQALDICEQNYHDLEKRASNLRALVVRLMFLSQDLTIEFSKVC